MTDPWISQNARRVTVQARLEPSGEPCTVQFIRDAKGWHPLRALYLLGAEDHGLPPEVLARCHEVVQVPSPSPYSLNVAVAGSLVLYDRYRAATAAQAVAS